MKTIYQIPSVMIFTAALVLGFLTTQAFTWERGLNSGSWTKGATLNVFVDDLPADAPAGSSAAVDEAIKEWNDAQATFGGLQLVRQDTSTADKKTEAKKTSDIHVSWNKSPSGSATHKKDGVDKANNAFTKDTVRMAMSLDGVNSRGMTRDLKHEFGHAEGLAHSAKSELMKADAYSSTPGKGPSVADLNKVGPFIAPTDDDKAGKKSLWGTKEKLSRSQVTSNVFFGGGVWNYNYSLQALDLAGLTDPVTEFTLDLGAGTDHNNIEVTDLPQGWSSSFFDVFIEPEGRFTEDEEGPSPFLLSFFALDPLNGLEPGQSAEFSIESLIGPGQTRAFTNSPNFDSDEFRVVAPVVPEPSTLLMAGFGLLGLFGSRRKKIFC